MLSSSWLMLSKALDLRYPWRSGIVQAVSQTPGKALGERLRKVVVFQITPL